MATMAIETSPRMKAAVRRRWGRPRDVVEVTEVAKPAPADDEVLVRVRASSVNRSDYYALGGVAVLMRPMIGGFLRPKDEHVGGDFAGVAEAVGKDVDDVTPGDEVYGVRSGAYAEYVSAKTAVSRKPAGSPSRKRRRCRSQALPHSKRCAITGISSRASVSSSTAPRAAWARSPSSLRRHSARGT